MDGIQFIAALTTPETLRRKPATLKCFLADVHWAFGYIPRDSPDMVADSRDSPDMVADSRDNPDMVADSRDNPNMVADSMDSPDMVADSRECPNMVADSRECPNMVADSRECPDMVADSRDNPDMVADSRECPDMVAERLNNSPMADALLGQEMLLEAISTCDMDIPHDLEILDIPPFNSSEFELADTTNISLADNKECPDMVADSSSVLQSQHLPRKKYEKAPVEIKHRPTDRKRKKRKCTVLNIPQYTDELMFEDDVQDHDVQDHYVSDSDSEYQPEVLSEEDSFEIPVTYEFGLKWAGVAGGTSLKSLEKPERRQLEPRSISACETVSKPKDETSSVPGKRSEKISSVPGKPTEETSSVPGKPTEETSSVPGKPTEETSSVPGKPTEETSSVPGKPTEETSSVPVQALSTKVTVQTCNNEEHRVWDKRQCCPYCMSLYPKLPRHLEQKHSTEIEVAKLMSFPKKSKERNKLCSELRNKGNFAFNKQVIKSGEGSIIPYRRPSADIKPDSSRYLPCSNCLAFFNKDDLWKHTKKCPAVAKANTDSTQPRQKHQQASNALLPASETATQNFKEKILDTMSTDQVSLVARQDFLIVTFGEKMYSKVGHLPHQYNYVRCKLRELARLLINVRVADPSIIQLKDCIDPTKFKVVVAGVKETAGYISSSGTYKIPSLALKLGHSLKKCSRYLKAEALQTEDKTLKEKAESFEKLIEVDWNTSISSQALSSLSDLKYNKPKCIPLAQDLKKFNLYLQNAATENFNLLQATPSERNWRMLSELTLVQLTLFNRRRAGEMQRMTTSNYHSGMKNSDNIQEEILESLSSLEKELVKHIKRVEIRGKKGRKVAVLFTEQLQHQVNALIETRDVGNINCENHFLFPNPGDSVNPLRCCDVIRKFANDCGADRPELLTSTSLRKHIAVVMQLLNLKEHELDWVAGFMGHDIRVHREFYRLPEDTLQLAKVSKLLLNMEKGDISKWKGKSLEDISVSPEDFLSDDEPESQNDDESLSDDEPESQNDDESEDELGDDIDINDDVPVMANEVKASQKKKKVKSPASQNKNNVKSEKTCPKRRPWSNKEKSAVQEHLGMFIRLKKCPGKRDIEAAKSKTVSLKDRDWKSIKYFVKNAYSTKK